ncbi:MAG: hypothetical protein DRP97_04775 [Candidatus Latescibacterota bacterium]|nr:MAG: hypothetical protein DRP97_04775 [Candidatus Latescibacterota bacterium]
MARKRNIYSQANSLFKTEVPKMPEGYYSGDKPNPNLRKFVEKHLSENPYQVESDSYDVSPFETPLTSTRSRAIYGLHPYHQGKKPHDSIREYIRHYTSDRDLVLDPMCGSGSTALAALLENRKAIAIDYSPAATFITSRYCTPVDTDAVKAAFMRLLNNVAPIMNSLYQTTCPKCQGLAEIQYVVWSERYQCLRCAKVVPLHSCRTEEVDPGTYPGFERGQGRKKSVSICPFCNRQPISTRQDKYGMVPVEISVKCLNRCTPGQIVRQLVDPEDYDYQNALSPKVITPSRWIPKELFSEWAEKHDGLSSRGIKNVSDFFTKRNLLALSEIYHHIINSQEEENIKNALTFIFTASLMSCSKKAQHLKEGGGYIPGNFHIPPVIKERNVPNSMKRVFSRMLKGLDAITREIRSTDIIISTQTATNLSAIPSNSIDYIFTDPPYGAAVQYGELNILWESWLGFDRTWLDGEIIVNYLRGKTEQDWQELMWQVLSECYRVLKPGRAISICYHDASGGTWPALMDAAATAGFLPEKTERALTIQMQQRTFNQSTSNEIVKRDLVVTFRKPSAQLSNEIYASGSDVKGSEGTTFNEVVSRIIYAQLMQTPGITIDRLYDIAVSKLVRLGRMEKHDFRSLVESLAEPSEDNPPRWFLKESELEALDPAESAKEDEAADILGKFIDAEISQSLLEGVHYSDLFEHYIFAVKHKPRRLLSDWIPDYFYRTENGAWRTPSDDEEQKIKAEARKKGTSRRIKRYLAYLEEGTAIPEKECPNDATLAEWIRHCKRSGLYEQGKFLYEKGGLNLDNLPEEAMVNVEEDYQVCVRMLARNAKTDSGKKTKRGRRRKKSEAD